LLNCPDFSIVLDPSFTGILIAADLVLPKFAIYPRSHEFREVYKCEQIEFVHPMALPLRRRPRRWYR
jgi:hypothetical protein